MSVTRTREGELTLFQVRGDPTPHLLLDALREFLEDPTRLVLWDMRACRFGRFDPDQLRKAFDGLMRSDHSKRPQRRSAFVCRGEGDCAVVRLLVAYAEARHYPADLAVFSNITQARHWLAEG